MSHRCKAALVRCMDFRLEKALHEYLQTNGLVGDVDIISWAGAAKDMNEGFNVIEQIKLSKKLHDIDTVILINHTDCGGYGGSDAFDNTDHEKSHHEEELRKAMKRVQEELPGLKVELCVANIENNGGVTIEQI